MTLPRTMANANLISETAERVLLAAIMRNNDAMSEVFGARISANDFAFGEHRTIFEAMLALNKERRHIAPLTLAPVLGSISPDNGADLHEYLFGLPVNEHLPASEAAATVKDLAVRRSLVQMADAISSEAHAMDISPAETAREVITMADGIISTLRRKRNSACSIKHGIRRAIDQMFEREKNPPVSTGYESIDKMLGGLFRGEMTILAGRPGMGKSAVATSIAIGSAKSSAAVAMFSAEMTIEAITARALSDAVWNSINPLPYSDMRRRKPDETTMRRIVEGAKKIENLPLYMDDQAGLTVSEIMLRSERFAADAERAGHRLGLIVIDYLGLLKATRPTGNLYTDMTEISHAAMQLGKDMDCHVLALHQLSRNVEQRADKRPMLSDLRDTGALEQDADNVIFAFRPEYYLAREKFDDPADEARRLDALHAAHNKLELGVAKQRAGPTGTVHMFVDIGSNAMREMMVR